MKLHRRPGAAAIGALLAGLALAAAAAVWQDRANAAGASARFDALVANVVRQVEARMQPYAYGLRGARGAVGVAGIARLDRQTFRSYSDTRDLEDEFPGAGGFGVVRRVAAADEGAFVAAARRDGWPDFAVHPFEPHTGDRYIVQYVEPIESNAGGIGVDIASEPGRRTAAVTAMRTARAVLTPPMTLRRPDARDQSSFLLLLPIYAQGREPTTMPAREAATVGWTFAHLSIDDLLKGIDFDGGAFTLALRDRSDAGAVQFFASPDSGAPPAAGLGRTVAIPVYGRLWEADVRARPRFIQTLDQPNPRVVGMFGALFAILLAMLLDVHARGKQRATQWQLEHNAKLEGQVAERTDLFEAARRDLQAIVDAVPSMIGYWDRNLLNRFANQAYGTWYDTAPGAIKGQHKSTLLGDATYERCLPYIEAALRGEPQRFELALPGPGGVGGEGVRHAIAHYMPDVVGGVVQGFYVLVHDITEQTQDKARLAAAMRENAALLGTIDLHAIVSVADRGGCILDVNSAFCTISGYAREELVGQNHRIVNSGVQGAAFWIGMWSTIANGKPWRGEICNRAKDGSVYWVDSMVLPLLGADGEIEKYISFGFDVTAAKLNEQRLRASEALLDRAGRVAGVGCWELDFREQQVTWSEQTHRIHEVEPGYRPRLESALDFYPPGSRERIERAVADGMANGTGWDLELPLVTAKGRAIWVRCVGAVEHEGGEPVRLVGAFQDVTARKQVELQLQQANERFSLACEAAGIGVWEWDIDADLLSWDDRMYRLYQRSDESGAGVGPYALWADNLHPQDRARVEAALQSGVRGEQPFDTEFRILWPNGEVRHLKTAGHVQRGADGVARRMTGVNFDITERKRAEIALLETSSMLASVLDAASEVSIIATAPDHTIKVFNRGAQLLLGYGAEEMVGVATPVSIHDAAELDARALELGAELGRPVSGGDVFTEASMLRRSHSCTYVAKDGRRIDVSLVVTAICGRAGEILGYLGIAHDVTLQKRLERSLREATQQAECDSLAKSRFLACMSHEIRTPMNAVLGLAYLLGRTPLDDEQAGFLSKIERAGKSLLSMVNDSLDISRIEAGDMRVACEPFSPNELLDRLQEMAGVQSDAGGIGFELDIPSALPTWLQGDAFRLGQVLTNLTSNAIKFTRQGGVRLVVSKQPAEPGHAALRFEVHDTGIGISAQDARHLFKPFAQADTSISRRFGGTGLGLSIAKQLTELMGGRIGLESTLGVGSMFWVEVGFTLCGPPVPAPREAERPGRHGPHRLKDVRVLVVDDSQINLEVARRILGLEGARVSLAGNGLEALECLRLRPGDVDIVLMDVHMPVLDGLEATRRIRAEPRLRELPVIGLTAGGLSSQRAEAVASGMDDFLVKPLEPHELVACIRRHVPGGDGVEVATDSDAAGLAAPSLEVAWPEIAGIVAHDVATRLGGDQDLFRRMLTHLLDEFASASALQGGVDDEDARPGFARTLHKLAGSAANLGARAIAALAAEAEAACLRGDRASAHRTAQRLNASLQALQRSAAGWLNEAPAVTPGIAAPADDPLPPLALAHLRDLLRRQQASAVEQFESVSNGLRQRLGSERHARVRDHIDNLRFTDAEQELALDEPS